MTQYNPFIHGYTDFRIERTLQITYEDDCPPAIARCIHRSKSSPILNYSAFHASSMTTSP